MSSWKQQAEDREAQRRQREREEEIRRNAPRLAREQAERAAKREREEREWGEKYKCHILGCNTRSHGPVRTHTWDTDSYFGEHVTLNEPDMLEKCKKCGKWTCYEHLHQYICQNCWK